MSHQTPDYPQLTCRSMKCIMLAWSLYFDSEMLLTYKANWMPQICRVHNQFGSTLLDIVLNYCTISKISCTTQRLFILHPEYHNSAHTCREHSTGCCVCVWLRGRCWTSHSHISALFYCCSTLHWLYTKTGPHYHPHLKSYTNTTTLHQLAPPPTHRNQHTCP